jgi:hypothetical protein
MKKKMFLHLRTTSQVLQHQPHLHLLLKKKHLRRNQKLHQLKRRPLHLHNLLQVEEFLQVH